MEHVGGCHTIYDSGKERCGVHKNKDETSEPKWYKRQQTVVVWKRDSSKMPQRKASERKIRQIRTEVSIYYK